MTEVHEGRTWHLGYVNDCKKYSVDGLNLVVSVPLLDIEMGDLVSWEGSWHRVIGIDSESMKGGLILELAAAGSPASVTKTDDPFHIVQPGHCWWWWFELIDMKEVFRIVRDGSGGLWVSDDGHGNVCKLSEFRGKPLGPVKAYKE